VWLLSGHEVLFFPRGRCLPGRRRGARLHPPVQVQPEMYFELHLAGWLIEAGRREIDWRAVNGIVPVPLFPRKERHREFNQAERLARALGRRWTCRCCPGICGA